MSPELAARIALSVRGRRTGHIHGALGVSVVLQPKIIAIVRALLAGCFAVLLVLGISAYRHRTPETLEVDRQRASLLLSTDAATGSLGKADLDAEGRIEAILARASGSYEGDVVDPSLRLRGALDELLASPSVYLRGAEKDLRTAMGLRTAAAASVKDPLLACLLTPPAARADRTVLSRVRDVYAGSAERQTTQVIRLNDVLLGLPFLHPSFRKAVVEATTTAEVGSLRLAFESAPVLQARRGLKARLLIYAVDEEPEVPVPAELDGERAHPMRMGVVDLATEKTVLRMRRFVDPSKIPSDKRVMYAAGMDACGFAFDARESVKGPR
jgi:hypothetical protein